MNGLGLPSFDEIPEPEGPAPLPDGEYTVVAVEADLSETKKKQEGLTQKGTKVSVKFEVLEGPHKGRKIFSNYNIHNDSQTSENIGRADLKSLCKAIGLGGFPSNVIELCGKMLIVKTKLKGEYVNITAYKPYGVQQQVSVATQSAPAQSAKPTGWG